MEEHEKWMRRCLQLAECGRMEAAPNPMVGAVIVCDGRIIGEGYHIRCGEAHAEVNAVASVKDEALLRRSTLYVSLEPCSHYGKTPPCAELIIKKGIPRVVVGCIDPFAKVQGRGIQMLREAGVEVTVGVCEKECLELNRHFITFHTKRRPYVTLKWAQSADGFIDKCRDSGLPVLLSTPHTLMRVHRLRAESQALLVGRRTAELDNPSLTVRHWVGPSPMRIVLDSKGILSPNLNLFDGSVDTMVVGQYAPKGVELFVPQFQDCVLSELLTLLYERNIQTLLVEGGREVLQGFLDFDLWDEVRVEISAVRLGDGVKAPNLPTGATCWEETLWGVPIRHFLNTQFKRTFPH